SGTRCARTCQLHRSWQSRVPACDGKAGLSAGLRRQLPTSASPERTCAARTLVVSPGQPFSLIPDFLSETGPEGRECSASAQPTCEPQLIAHDPNTGRGFCQHHGDAKVLHRHRESLREPHARCAEKPLEDRLHPCSEIRCKN